MIDIEAYLKEKGIGYRLVNWQYSMTMCRCCWELKKDKFYMSAETWMWDCKICSQKWNLNHFRELYLDNPIKLEWQTYRVPDDLKKTEYRVVEKSEIRNNQARLLWGNEKALEYLTKRWINEETIKYFKLGVSEKNELSIPVYKENKVIDIIYRQLPWADESLAKYHHDSWGKLDLLNRSVLETKEKPKEVYITEGSFDCMSISQNVTPNVVGNTWWCQYKGKEWLELFKGVKRIFICYDFDKLKKKIVKGKEELVRAWEEWAKALSKFLWDNRCCIVKLEQEETDINDYFLTHTKEDFLKLVENSRPKKSELVKHISEYWDELINSIEVWETKWISTWIEALNDIIGWYKPWHMILIWAITSAWKSSYSSNLALALGYQWVPIYFTSLEMTPVAIAKKLLQMTKQIWLSELENPNLLTIEQVKDWVNKLSKMPIYLYDNCWLGTYSIIEQWIRSAINDYDIKIAFIDYLQYFQLEGKNRVSETWDLVNKIKALAMELQITIILITQLNRSWRGKQKTWLYLPTLTDLKDSSTLEQSADTVIFIARDNESPLRDEQRKTVIKVAKNREGKTGYYSANFDWETWIFSTESEIDYLKEAEEWGWTISKMEWDSKYFK